LRWLILLMVGVSWQPKPTTTADLIYKAKMQSVSKVCDKPRKSETVKEICKRWERQRGSK
jgi:hypothetical protein